MLRYSASERRHAAIICCILVMTPFFSACHRGYYRRMADAEAAKLIQQKSNDIRWESADGSIDIDPQSRMFDPFSKDHPPMPPDDPASAQFMECVDGRPGFPHWHANGDTLFVENPEWKSYLPVDEQGRVIIDTNTAIALSLIHSPTYQSQREELYLSALNVAIERFNFDSQLGAGISASTRTAFSGAGTPATSLDNTYAYRKLGITGANFTVGLANSMMWNFLGSGTATRSLGFSIVQPLLRNAGREFWMESLTQAERTLLGNVRAWERYRQGFYLEVLVGRNTGQALSRSGGGFLGTPSSASINASSSSILGLLQQQQQIRFAEFNVQQLDDTVEQLREFFNAQQIDSLQVQQAEINLYTAQQELLNQQVNYQNSLDLFKRTLGIPPDLEVVIKDDYLDRFILISDEIQTRQQRMNSLRRNYGTQATSADDVLQSYEDQLKTWKRQTEAIANNRPIEGEQVEEPKLPGNLIELVLPLANFVDQGLDEVNASLNDDCEQIRNDFQRYEESLLERLEYLQNMRQQFEAGEFAVDIDPEILDEESLPNTDELRNRLQTTIDLFSDIQQKLNGIKELIESLPVRRTALNDEQFAEFVNDEVITNIATQLTRFSNQLTELSLLQVLARGNSIGLKDVDIDASTAIEIARCFRLDWMNARSALVDSWRKIEFFADQLESQFDLRLDGGVNGAGGNPFNIQFASANLSGGFQFDTPIVRLQERNRYRQALIEYQRSRRSYYQFEDEIKRNLRQTVRTIKLNKIQFELSRRNLQASIQNLEQSRLRLEQPPAFSAGGGARTTSLGATTSRDLTTAINSLNTSQTRFLGVWLQYEVLRRGLDNDLGTFQIDDAGHWIDPVVIDNEIGLRAAAVMGLDPSCLECGPMGDPMIIIDSSMDTEDSSAPDASPDEPPTPATPSETKPQEGTGIGLGLGKSLNVERPSFEPPLPSSESTGKAPFGLGRLFNAASSSQTTSSDYLRPPIR